MPETFKWFNNNNKLYMCTGEDGNPLQCSCLENSMDRGAWWATVHEAGKSQT